MSRILVAGAGHGGLVAAAELAKKGHSVTVFEKESEELLGHDWEDRFTFSLLEDLGVCSIDKLPDEIWRYRGDCAFVSPDKQTKIEIRYNDDNRQKLMWRRPLLQMLIAHAKKCGVQILFETCVEGPVLQGSAVVGLKVDGRTERADCVIDAAGAFSPVRMGLPKHLGIESAPKYGDLFYGYRAYFKRDLSYPMPAVPFEVYLYHEGEQGLSWCCTNEDCVDILIGRVDPLTPEKVKEQLAIFRKDHPWVTEEIVNGGQYGVIPVRRPLAVMVADGYAAVGDSAFMTTPMNGMGIDLSLQAGKLLAQVMLRDTSCRYKAQTLWEYNRTYHLLWGGEVSRNEGLKNAILSLPSVGVDRLFESGVIESSDLAGGGSTMSVSSLMAKVSNGLKISEYFFPLVKGLGKGALVSKLYCLAPKVYNRSSVLRYAETIAKLDIHFVRK